MKKTLLALATLVMGASLVAAAPKMKMSESLKEVQTDLLKLTGPATEKAQRDMRQKLNKDVANIRNNVYSLEKAAGKKSDLKARLQKLQTGIKNIEHAKNEADARRMEQNLSRDTISIRDEVRDMEKAAGW